MTTTVTITTKGGRRTPPSRHRGVGRWSFDKVSFMAVFLVLPLAVFLVFVISPFIQAAYYSLTDWNGFTQSMNFIGFQNYVELAQDPVFMRAVLNVILLAIVVPLFTVVVALVLASVVTVAGPSRGQIRGVAASGFYRSVSFLPYCIPAIVIGLIWFQVYDPAAGLLNGFLTGIGLDGFENFAWLGEVSTAMPASMWVIIWAFIGFYAILFVAGIKGIPAETFEAARIDGAGRFRTLVSITIPSLRDTIQTAYIYLGIAALDSFVFMSALFPNAGGPQYSTMVITQRLYQEGFTKGHFGYATAMGVVLAILTLLFAAAVFIVNRVTRGKEEGRRS